MTEVPIRIAAFYYFKNVSEEQLQSYSQKICLKGQELDIRGLVICGNEGINFTVEGKPWNVDQFLKTVYELYGVENPSVKYSSAEKHVFRKFKVQLRDEIVTTGFETPFPDESSDNHLSPAEWDRVMKEEDVVVLDTRNDYETKIGVFRGAVDPNIKVFSEFPEFVENSGIPKDKKVLMYCTGGIRCEKGIYEMQRQGYENVYQLKGGILNYLKEFPNQEFEGECFVFDGRISVDQDLKPSTKYVFCPHCGDPAETHIECAHCDIEAIICEKCIATGIDTCSKNCAYHQKRVANL